MNERALVYAPGETSLHRTDDPNNALGNGPAVHNRLGEAKANGAVFPFGRSRSHGARVADRPLQPFTPFKFNAGSDRSQGAADIARYRKRGEQVSETDHKLAFDLRLREARDGIGARKAPERFLARSAVG